MASYPHIETSVAFDSVFLVVSVLLTNVAVSAAATVPEDLNLTWAVIDLVLEDGMKSVLEKVMKSVLEALR